jgi:hypothetical protein
MKENQETVLDLSDLTCTNLMIRLKILLKKTPPGLGIDFIIRRDQKETIEIPFSRTGYDVTVRKIDTNSYQVTMKKKDESR